MIQLFKTKVHEEAKRNVQEVLDSSWLGLGPKVEAFEKAFADYIGAKYAIAFSSATAALHVAIKLSGLRQNQPVISTPLTFVSTNHVILYENLPLLFADTDLATGCLDLESIRKLMQLKTASKITDKSTHPKALMFVHYGGNVVDIDSLYEIAEEYKLTIIEDCAHACGARFKDEMIGKRAKFACFSFHAVKNLALGDGGMLTTYDEEIAQRARRLRWLGIDKSTIDRNGPTLYGWAYNCTELGYKYYMNDINAAIGLGQLPYLDTDNTLRRGIYETYKNAGLPMLSAELGSAHHLAVMLARDRGHKSAIMRELSQNEIQYGVHYLPNYYYEMYRDTFRMNGCINTEEFFDRCISLPNHLYLTEKDLMSVVDTIKGVA